MIPALPRSWRGAASGETVVFANSLGTTSRMWDRVVESLGAERRLLTFDLPGHVGPAVESFDWDELVECAAEVLDTEGVRHATVVGVSLGGALGIELAARRPDRVARVVAVNAPIRAARDFWLQRAELVEREGLADLAAGLRARWFGSSSAESSADSEAIIADFAALAPSGYAAACRALAQLDVAAAAAASSAPLLVVSAQDDQSVDPANSAEIAAAARDAVLWPVAAGGHLLPVTRPTLLTSLVEAFIASRPARVSAA